MPDAPGLELLAGELNGRRPGGVLGTSYEHGQAALIIDPGAVRETLTHLAEEPRGFSFLSSVHGADYLPREPRFAVHYELLNMARVERIRVKALLADPAAGGGPAGALPEIDSVTDLFPTADFQEREVYDFFGIVFRGHPDPRRILMPEDYVGFPQRRDFPVGGDEVIFTYDENEVPGWIR